jgi:pimeloyl-ACP methyl ester carboxylesterase
MKVKFLSTNNVISCHVRNFFSKQSDEVTKLISQSGYKGERHQVKTQDGYYLTVHRIPPKENVEYKGTVFLMHGLFRNSADYIATGPKVALPYFLADHGFDCYLGNARGSKYSQEHVKHPYNSKHFWNFSWEEIGLYDLPAMIEFSIDKSNSSKVNYIGHSQGCTTVVALLASRPEYNNLISQMHLMAPAVFMDGATSIAFSFWSQIIFVSIFEDLEIFGYATDFGYYYFYLPVINIFLIT